MPNGENSIQQEIILS